MQNHTAYKSSKQALFGTNDQGTLCSFRSVKIIAMSELLGNHSVVAVLLFLFS